MNDNKKEIRRIRLEDLDSSLQNILLNRISKDDPTWKKLQDIIDDLYKKTHIEKKNITITIVQSDNQTIHVYVPKKIGGVDYTSTFTCLTGTTYEAEVIAENGYKAGTLNVSRSGAFTNNKTINATSATKSNATVTITQSDNQTIHVYTPKKEGGTDHTSTFTCPVGTTYEAEVIAETGYTAGALNVGNSGTINSDMSINANPAISYAKVTIVQTDNQTIHVYTPQKSGGTDHTSSFTCSVGTTYEVEVIAASNYIAGTPNTKGGTFNSNMIINATSATVATAKVTIVQSDNQTIHVYTPQKSGGTDHTSSFTCPIGTTYEAEVIAASGYNAGTLNVSGGGVINSDKTINATPATKPQIFIAKGSKPWYNLDWIDSSHVVSVDESIPGQATVTCRGVTNMTQMFDDCSNITSLNLSNFDTSNVTDMMSMVAVCQKLTTLDLSNLDTSNVRNMEWMFKGCTNLSSVDLSSFNISKVTNMSDMFDCCFSITSIDLSNVDTSNVTNMAGMFNFCDSLTTIKGVINMKSCTDYHGMFYICPKLKGVKIKNPPVDFESETGLSSSRYTIVS